MSGHAPGVNEVALQTAGTELSGLLAPASEPRALVVALHGGGTTAGYFHGQTHPDLSLLDLGRRLGFAVLALDRPGYGRSQPGHPDGVPLPQQAQLVLDALEGFVADNDCGVGVFVVGHSYGLKLGLHMAAHPRGSTLLGLAGSGAAYRYLPEPSCPDRRERLWGPAWLSPELTLAAGMRPVAPVPAVEAVEKEHWTAELPALASQVRIPLQLTVADHEQWWQSDDAALSEYRKLFPAAPVLVTRRQLSAGHNISLGWAARSYHLSVLAFAELCLQRRRSDG